MTQVLRAQLTDVPLLAGYLHDSRFVLNDYRLIDGDFSLPLQRISYESAEPGRFLFVMPVIRYPVVTAELRAFGVHSVEHEWNDERDRDLHSQHTLLDLEASEESLTIETEWLLLTVRWQCTRPYVLELIDTGVVSKKLRVIDAGERVFTGEDEIKRLRHSG